MNKNRKNIVLIGFMGSGKSTLGKRIAKQLKARFIDMDAHIEQQEGKTIAEIFAQNGELFFRESEKKLLQELQKKENCVISTGGGTPCFENNMDLINQLGTSVYIQLSPEMLKSRLIHQKTKRPLIATLSDEELLKFITEKLQERKPYYEKAQIIFNPLTEKEEELISRVVS